jgi:hypothetical protein
MGGSPKAAHFFFLKYCLKNAEIKYMREQEKAYVILNKHFLVLQNKITRYKIAKLKPPDRQT